MPGWIAPLFRLSFWFAIAPPPLSPGFRELMLWGNAAFVLIAGFLLILSQRNKNRDVRKFIRRVSSFCFWFGFIGLFLYGMNWLQVPVLGMRFLLLFWIAPFLIWAVKLALYWFRDRPKTAASAAERQAYEKWLPKPGR